MERRHVELSICLYPQQQLTSNPQPFFLAARLSFDEKAPPGINFLPLFLAAQQRKDQVIKLNDQVSHLKSLLLDLVLTKKLLQESIFSPSSLLLNKGRSMNYFLE